MANPWRGKSHVRSFLLDLDPLSLGQQEMRDVLVHQEGYHAGGHHARQTRLETLVETFEALEAAKKTKSDGG